VTLWRLVRRVLSARVMMLPSWKRMRVSWTGTFFADSVNAINCATIGRARLNERGMHVCGGTAAGLTVVNFVLKARLMKNRVLRTEGPRGW
jgi:hypothetical protein